MSLASRDDDLPTTCASPEPIRAVLVDDSDEVRFVLAALLELGGAFEIVGEASSVAAARRLLRTVTPDLVVIDLRLGRRNGTSLIQDLRRAGHDTPIAVVTGSRDGAEHDRARAAGADAVYNKNVSTRTLVAGLVSLVDERSHPSRDAT